MEIEKQMIYIINIRNKEPKAIGMPNSNKYSLAQSHIIPTAMATEKNDENHLIYYDVQCATYTVCVCVRYSRTQIVNYKY